MGLLSYIGRRVLFSLPIILVISIFVFSLVHLAPGDPVTLLVNPRLGEEAREQKRKELGLNQPLPIQYIQFMKEIITGQLGKSYYSEEKISVMLAARLPNTLALTGLGLVFSYIIAIPAGVIAALNRGKFLDYASMSVALIGLAMPQFWLGLLLMLVFSVHFNLLPVAGVGSFQHLILPSITLGAYGAALTARITRSSMLEVLHKDYIRTARAKGLKERIVCYKHALRNALIPIISLLGMRIGWLVGGAVMVEVVFTRPGIGRLMVNSIYRRDYLVVQIIILMLAFSVIAGNLLADILNSLTDPQIRYN